MAKKSKQLSDMPGKTSSLSSQMPNQTVTIIQENGCRPFLEPLNSSNLSTNAKSSTSKLTTEVSGESKLFKSLSVLLLAVVII